MLPGVDPEKAQLIKSLSPGATLYKYANLPPEERSKICKTLEVSHVEQQVVLDALPIVKLKMDAFVDGDEECCIGDVLTVKLRVDFTSLEPGQMSGYVHSKSYPFLRRDSWYLLITDSGFNGIAACEKLPIEQNFYEKTLTERLARPGPIAFMALLINDSYRGLD